MIFGVGTGRVVPSQKVADTKKPTDPRGCFTVAWDRHEVKIADVVGIKGTAHISIENVSNLTVTIWCDGKYYTGAQNVRVLPKGQITAVWKVAPRRVGDFEKGTYHAVISYGSLSGSTTRGLKIVKAGKVTDGFDR